MQSPSPPSPPTILTQSGTHVPARPAAGQSFCYKWGAASWGEWHMFMFDSSALMAPRRPPWTANMHFRYLYPIVHSLSAVTLRIYLCVHTHPHSLHEATNDIEYTR